MIKALSKLILFKWMGWTADISVQLPPKCIIAVAPHTSNMDFIIGILYSRAIGLKANFLMKKEWFVGPLGPFMKSLGGIPVYRSKNAASPTSWPKRPERWIPSVWPSPPKAPLAGRRMEKGFYYIALKAGIPIMLYGLDFKEKRIVCHKAVMPDGNIQEQMQEIISYFKSFQGRHPEKFGFPK